MSSASGMSSSSWTPPRKLKRISAVDELAAELRALVLDGNVRAGSQLREAEIAGNYEVARSTVRASLQRLVHDGLLQHEPHRGVFVPRLTPEDVADMYRFRGALETEAAIRICEERLDPSTIIAAVDRLESLTDAPWRDLMEADLDVHKALVHSIGSPRIERAFASILSQLRLVAAQPRDRVPIAELTRQHRVIATAVASGKVAVAVHEVRAHLAIATDRMVRALLEAPPTA